jgi:ribonuclease BN (tRNA processing enzyme)
MRYHLLGVGEAFDAPLGNTSTVLTAASRLLLDCGYAVPAALWAHNGDADFLDGIYISHAHGDHFFGFTPLIGRLWESGRTRELAVVTQEPVFRKLQEAMELAYPGILAACKFDLRFLPAAAGATVRWREFDLRFAPSRHSVPNLAVRLETAGRSFAYSGDGQFTPAGRDLFAGVDVLLHEAYSFEPHPNHGDIEGVIAMAAEAGVRRLLLTHLNRDTRVRDRGRIDPAILPEPGADGDV